jgi:probable phosphoglycerate mutase
VAEGTPPTRFGLVRHAQTLWNVSKRIQGQADTPLTAHGAVAAAQWGRSLKGYGWSRILSSDADRAVHTARLVNTALKVPVVCLRGLREQDWGRWTGRTMIELRRAEPVLFEQMERDGWTFRPPGGEERRAVLERGRRALENAAAAWPGRKMLVVTHQGMIQSLIYGLPPTPGRPASLPLLQRYALHWLVQVSGSLTVEAVNALELADGGTAL